jgi:hypothetical protein
LPPPGWITQLPDCSCYVPGILDDVTELVLVLCGAVVKTAFKLWVGDNTLADNLSADLTDMIKSRVSGSLDQRKVRARFGKMEEIVADQVLSILNTEFRNLDEGERNAAISAVTETFDRARLTDKVLFAGNLDPFYLENFVRQFTGQSTRDLSEGGTGLYDRVLAQCCAYIIEIADKLPHFQTGAFAELLGRDSQILARLEDVLERLPAPAKGDTGPDRVETAYRQRIAKVFDRLELFGLDFAAQWYALSIAYVNLKLSVGGARTRSGEPFESWLAEYPKLVIDGRAGSGKTTILQWIAVRAARRDFEGPASWLNGHVPFFLRLREYAGSALPAPEEFLDKVAPLLAPDPDARPWPRKQLLSGQAFVLVDGVDEVSEAQRPAVLAWLQELVQLFPRVRYVITTRPGAIDKDAKDALDEAKFVWTALDPMEPALIRAFVDQWHAAMREWQKDAESAEQLAAFRDELVKTLDNDRFLSELASTPLLAGLICALNQHLNAQLPRRRTEIFEKALAMFHQRDRKRKITGGVTLDLVATNHLLGDLALWMVRNGAIEVGADSAGDILQRSSRSLPSGPYDVSALYRHLLLRSGVLREPTTDFVDFVHRNFQEYLAARALIETDNVGEIIKNAADDQWREVTILSAGQGNIRQTTDLLRGLLSSAQRDKVSLRDKMTLRDKVTRYDEARNQRRLLAVASLDEIRGATHEILADIERALPELVPPRSMDEAEALSHAGERLIPHLARAIPHVVQTKTFRDAGELPMIIRAATLIGGQDAFNLITEIAQHSKERIANSYSALQALRNEFTRAWQYFEPILYAERIIFPLGIHDVRVTDWRLLEVVAKAPTIAEVTLSVFVTDGADLSAFDGARFSSLAIEDCDIHSLTGIIRDWPSIKNVTLRRCRWLEDISSLRLLNNLEQLEILYCNKITSTIGISPQVHYRIIHD